MEDITIEGIRILFNEQFGIFAVDLFVFGAGTTIGAIGAKLIRIPRISTMGDSHMGDNNVQSNSPSVYAMFGFLNVHNHPPANEEKDQPNEKEDK